MDWCGFVLAFAFVLLVFFFKIGLLWERDVHVRSETNYTSENKLAFSLLDFIRVTEKVFPVHDSLRTTVCVRHRRL